MKRKFVITIDGPCRSGKTTAAKTVAEKLGAMYLDTGALYRAAAYALMSQGVDSDTDDVEKRDSIVRDVLENRMEVSHESGKMRIRLDGTDVSDNLRTEAVSDGASRISVYPSVRDAVNAAARKIAGRNAVVVEGRDTGTCLFPDADIKLYLTADLQIRAARRMVHTPDEFKTIYDAVAAVATRDGRDMTRDVAPLPTTYEARRAGLEIVDNTAMDAAETADFIVETARKTLGM